MDIRFHTKGKGGVRLDCLIFPTFSDGGAQLAGRFSGTPVSWVVDSEALNDHTGKKDEITVCYGASSSVLARILLVGMGDKAAFTLEGYRQAMAGAIRRCKALRLARLGMVLDDFCPVAETLGKPLPDIVYEMVTATLLAGYSCTEFRSAEAKAKGKRDNDLDFFTPGSLSLLHTTKAVPASIRMAVRLAEAEAAGVKFARDLVNTPANIMTPARMAEEAMALAKRYGLGCRVLHKAEMDKLGMGGILAVNEGSKKDPRFIVLEHNPRGGKKRHPLIFVGKGITFDSGGISLKPAAGMHHMKGDMAGAAAVLGMFEALGRFAESVSHPVIGLIPCAENMPGGSAFRPGDVITTMSGKTVEVLNTDAEGRLILCDALTYAQKNWTPLAVVDIATLTGACMVALGRGAAGLFTESTTLRDTIMNIGDEVGDTFWPMPLWGTMRDGLKSDVADIANVGPREGGAIAAAVYLQSFIEKNIPWAHLDMAGAGMSEKGTALCPKGATGFGVRTLFTLARYASEKMFK